MPSKRRQLNVRLDPEASARFDRLLRSLSAKMGVELTQSQLVAMALKALDNQKKPRK